MTMLCRTLTEFCVDLFRLGIKILLSRAAISNADFYHLIKGRISYIYFFWNADKIPLQNRQYRSLFHSGTGKKEVMVIVSQICGQISQVTPSFFGYVSLFTSTQSQFFLSPVKRELKSEIESSKLILWSARNRRLTMLWYKLTLFVQHVNCCVIMSTSFLFL